MVPTGVSMIPSSLPATVAMTGRERALPASAKKTLLQRRRPLGVLASKNTKSWCGEQFLPVDCKAKARRKGVFLFTDAARAEGITPLARAAQEAIYIYIYIYI